MLRISLTLLAVLAALLPALAQSDLGEMITALKAKSPKCVVLIMDVSESMKVDDYNRKMRYAAGALLKDGLNEGDRVVLYTFGAGYRKVFDETPTTPAARRKLMEALPLKPEPGEGTNIRQPHHEALKLALASGKTPFLIILTDSFNDPPKNTPSAYTEYQKYYTPGKLDVYPNTPENRDYELQLKNLESHEGKVFGIGVEILPSGRPKESFKIAPKEGLLPTPEPAPEPTATTAPPSKVEEFPIGLLVGVGGVTLLGILFALLRPKPLPLRIVGVGAPRDFDVRSNTTLRLGGEGVSGALDAYPLAGTKEVAATIKGSRGGFSIQPQPKSTIRVYHNGIPLEQPTPLRYGDEVRATILDANGAVIKDNRLKFSDPTKLV